MKREIMVAAAMLLTVGGLTACGPNKEKVMQNTIDGFDKIKSAELDSNMKMTASSESKSTNVDMDMDITYTSRPKAAKVVAKSKLANGSSSTIEAVCDESDVYIRMPSMGKWYRKSLSSYDTVSRSTNQSKETASRYLRMMKKDKVDCDISSKGGSYILTFNAGKKFTDELKKDVFKQMSSTGTAGISSADLKKIDFKTFKYVIEVDKKNYLPKNYRINLTLTARDNGEKGTVREVYKGTYRNINNVKKIEMPSDYVDLSK